LIGYSFFLSIINQKYEYIGIDGVDDDVLRMLSRCDAKAVREIAIIVLEALEHEVGDAIAAFATAN